ncbi:DUF5682 family protein [Phytomonospora endophytica]|uniref:Mg-chelatase subunit ChlD n=1 Tax=Phytomonospora endophytica TaxID=714109 RepID=A0A841FQV7_9ACTN|nr:DUF5682 family protein [Phytomonospora endophytica]MBB6037213.1 Mg-chelatase subunit ChlD [Phytomonospora endophytica]GIG71286.1 hypothetical protein Pen01_75810 [Phytomonospora endophytica]
MTQASGPAALVDTLHESRIPYLIGVRHHSPALAAAMPELLAEAAPDAVCVELPLELQEWTEWLAHPETTAPVACSVADAEGERLGFYPFADFSPELAAIRWAHANGVPVYAIDLPAGYPRASRAREADPLAAAFQEAAGASDGDELWDRLVEAHAYGAKPATLRRAALAVGVALRGESEPSEMDGLREAWMRRRIAETGAKRPVAVIGAFHAPALVGEHTEPPLDAPLGEVSCALVPYTFALLDSRSGYPAGIRDPEWQQAVYLAAGDADAVSLRSARAITEVCARMRAAGHTAGTPDALAGHRLAQGLAALRGLAAPGRREIIEALGTTLGQGDQLGRARAVALACEEVLIGERRGRLPESAPRGGLLSHVEDLFDELRLPRDGSGKTLKLAPHRSALDRRRHITLSRLVAAGIPYGRTRELSGLADTAAVGREWTVRWEPRTSATLEWLASYGATLTQAATGLLRQRWSRPDGTAGERLILLSESVDAELGELTAFFLERLHADVVSIAGLPDLLSAYHLLTRAGGDTAEALRAEVAAAAINAVAGLAGSGDPADAKALAELVRLSRAEHEHLGAVRLAWQLKSLAGDGSPMTRGASAAALTLLDRADRDWLGARAAAWAEEPDGDRAAGQLRGALLVAGDLWDADRALWTPLSKRLEAWTDTDFWTRLPALRDGFDALSTAARHRLFTTVSGAYGTDVSLGALEVAPELLAAWAAADAAGRAAVGDSALDTVDGAEAEADPGEGSPEDARTVDRWRLVLGRQSDRLCGNALQAAHALDDLYGAGHGEGSLGIGEGGGAGTERAAPSIREWAGELERLFGSRVREEVLARAAARGRLDAITELDPAQVTPSIDLLTQVLSLAGSMPEAKLAPLRRLAGRLIAELTKALATRLRPALTGVTTARPTRRQTGRIDLSRTVRANLHTVREGPTLVPDRLIFKSRAVRSAEWDVHILVDVSGSMERSTVYSALVAAVLHGVPALSVHLTTFSTSVVDLSDHVADPLSLLMEVSVGGGTDIGKGLRYVRDQVKVPSRTIVAVVSDFDEGVSVNAMLAEFRLLVGGGSHVLGLAALDDRGEPVYNKAIAAQIAATGVPVAALSPTELADWIAGKVR